VELVADAPAVRRQAPSMAFQDHSKKDPEGANSIMGRSVGEAEVT
jgi:hypothetical protein